MLRISLCDDEGLIQLVTLFLFMVVQALPKILMACVLSLFGLDLPLGVSKYRL